MPLGKELLQQYVDLKKEIRDLKKRIDKLEQNLATTGHACVKGSSNTFPYTERTFHMGGFNISTTADRERILRQRKVDLEIRYDELLEMQTALEQWIYSIPDSRTRRILTYRYIDGLNWVQVAHRMGGKNTADSCRIAHDRFLEKK